MAKDTKRPKKQLYVSFKGEWRFPKLTTDQLDYGTDDYPKPDGEFSVQLIGDPSDPAVKAELAKLEPLHKQAIADAKEAFKELKPETKARLLKANKENKGILINDLYSEEFDKDTKEATGRIVFKFAMKHSGQYKKGPKEGKTWRRYPALFDAAGKPIKSPPEIWSGTIGRVSYEARPYFIPGTGAVGVKLSLEAARILELISRGERSASAYGFDGEEEGYSYEAPVKVEEDAVDPTETADESSASGDSDGNPDF